MAKDKQSVKVRRKLFQAELEGLLEKYDLFMDLRLKVDVKGITPVLIVDGMELLNKKPQPAEIAQMIKEGKVKGDVKEEKQEQRPDGESKKN